MEIFFKKIWLQELIFSDFFEDKTFIIGKYKKNSSQIQKNSKILPNVYFNFLWMPTKKSHRKSFDYI